MKGIIYAFTGATLWGLSSVCSDYLMASCGMSALFLTMARMVVAALLFGVFALTRCKNDVKKMLADKPSRRGVIIFGALGLFSCQVTYIISINCTNAGTATVFQSLSIVFIPLATWIMGRSKLTASDVAGAVLALVSVVAISTKGDISTLSIPLTGLVWGLINGVSETFYIMYPGKLFSRWGSMPPVCVGMVVGAIVALAAWAGWAAITPGVAWADITVLASLDAIGWLAFVGVCAIGTFVAFSLFLKGVSLIGPVKSALLGAMEPASSAVLCALWLATPFTGWDWFGLVLMLGTIFLVTLAGPKREAD